MQPNVSASLPFGLSFEVADLLLLQAWADFHCLRLAIDLDIRIGDQEYEEILGLYDNGSHCRRWTLWRSAEGIVVEPTIGRSRLFGFMTDAVEALIPAPDRGDGVSEADGSADRG